MTQKFADLAIKAAQCYIEKPSGDFGFEELDLYLENGKIVHLGSGGPKAKRELDLKGLSVFPGFIDSQVHFREPGLEHKEDLHTGSRSAVKGGITSLFEMPNTKPSTTSVAALEEKFRRAEGRMHCNFAFYAGATVNNTEELARMEKLQGCCGTKIFMGSSTGDLLVAEDSGVTKILKSITRNVAVHSEDEFRLNERGEFRQKNQPLSHMYWRDELTALNSTSRLIKCARLANKTFHVLHITTLQEMELLAANKDILTVEVTPQHLTLSAPEAYDRLGTLAQMNPPIRTEDHREALWKALNAGVVDVLGSDHAPHTLEEKAKGYPLTPSGMPGVQTTLPIMLDHVSKGRLTLKRLVELLITRPVSLFKINNKGRLRAGYDADISIVDMNKEMRISNSWIESKSKWTPFDNYLVKGWPTHTIVNGHLAMEEGQVIGSPQGQKIDFSDLSI